MLENNLVSIIIPNYNSAEHITETLTSVTNQTYSNWECIVVDDYSTDNSVEIVNKFVNRYPNKIFLVQNKKKGACAARNLGFKKSNGSFIQYLDSDDLLSFDKIEKQIKILINNPNRLAICNCWHFHSSIDDAYNTDVDFIFTSNSPADFLTNLWGANGTSNYVAVHSYLSPRNLIEKAGPWNDSLIKDQDGEFFARVVLKSEGLIYVPIIKCYYRRLHSFTSISSQKELNALNNNLFVTQLKEKHLFTVKKNLETKKAIAALYKQVAIDAWPQYKATTKAALNHCKRLGDSNFSPILGGKTIETIKHLLGWKIAKSISFYVHKILH